MSIKITEDINCHWTMENDLKRKDIHGKDGISYLAENDIFFSKENADFCLCKNGNTRDGFDMNRSILVRYEPPTISPHLYAKSFYEKFVATWSTCEVDESKNIFHFIIPQDFTHFNKFDDKKTKKIVLMSRLAGPFNHPIGLTEERKRVAEMLDKQFGGEFHTYGCNWTNQGYKGFVLPLEAKYNIVNSYKFNVCFENTNIDNYLTEKLFDSLICGSIPIYVGCKNVKDFVDEKCFISFEDRNIDLLKSKIIEILNNDELYLEKIDNMRKYILNGAECFSSLYCAKSLKKIIDRLI